MNQLIFVKQRWFSMMIAVTSAVIVPVSHAQSHPSGWSQRVMVLVQNPTGSTDAIAPQYSLQIENVANAAANPPETPLIFPYIYGWNGATPASVENLPAQKTGAVTNEDGSLALINYATETVTNTNVGITSPSAGTIMSQTLRYVMAANKQAGALTLIDLNASPVSAVQLNLPGVSGISMTPSATVALAFADDSNTVYMIEHLSGTYSTGAANGNWPANSIDCEPYSLPTFCAVAVTAPGVSVATYSNQNFDHPFKAMIAADGTVVYILSGGPEADGISAKVTAIPTGALNMENGPVATIPASPQVYSVPGGIDDGIVVSSAIYVAGQQQTPGSPGRWGGTLTIIDPTTSPATITTQSMADGIPVRMALADDNTLWIGSIRCNTGTNAFEASIGSSNQGGCLTVVNTANKTVAYVEPRFCDIDAGTVCSAGQAPMLDFGTGGSGDVTGIAPIPGSHIVYYVELGQVHARSTLFTSTATGYNLVSNKGDVEFGDYNNVTVAGTAVDIVYLDSTIDSDGTSTSTVH